MELETVLNSEKAREIIGRQTPMDKETIERVKTALSRQGVDLLQSAELDGWLISKGAEAITFSNGSMAMHTKVSASGFFEELIHYGQIKSGHVVDDNDLTNLLLEIEAKERLLKYKNAYRITDYEAEILANTLEHYKSQLKHLK
jgi:hypothetical protein